jgi:small-conductance mechanosensitive channel
MYLAITPVDDLTDWLRGNGLLIVLFILGATLLARFAKWVGRRITARIDATSPDNGSLVRSETAKHTHVLTQVITWVIIVLIWSVTAVLVLQKCGVPMNGLVAPAAAIGVALGFGAQRLVQDLFAGLFVIIERQYGFGDVVRISALGSESGVTGTVEEVTLRVTRLRTLSGEVVIVPNGQIVQVTNMSRDWARAIVDVPVPSTTDVIRAREILLRVGADAREDETLGPLLLDAPTVVGVERLELETLHVRIVARTLPGRQFEVGRELRARVALALQAEGIHVKAGLDTADPVSVA